MPSIPARLRPSPVLVAFILFAAAGLLESFHGYVGYQLSGRPEIGYTLRGQPMSFLNIAARSLPSWLVLGLLAGLALRLAERRPLFASGWLRSVAFHLPLAAVFSGSFLVTAATIRHFMFLGPEAGVAFGVTLLRYYGLYFNTYFLFYWGTVGVYSGFLHFRNLRERDLQAEKLQRQLAEARLQVLQQQLEPHFLYNTLNAVSGLALEGNVNGTVRTLALLGGLLRTSLRRNEQVITIAQELETLDQYLEIQRVRFDERLEVRMRVARDVLDAEIPTFLLQPVVENAVGHGIANRAEGGVLEVRIRRRGKRVHATVADTGAGVGTEPTAMGIGLSNTVARLEQLYGDEYKFRLDDRPGGGAVATLEWPFRLSGTAEAASPVESVVHDPPTRVPAIVLAALSRTAAGGRARLPKLHSDSDNCS